MDKAAIMEYVETGDQSTIVLNTSDNPYQLQFLPWDRFHSETATLSHSLSFRPHLIRSLSQSPILIVSNGLKANFLSLKSLPHSISEVGSTRYNFMIDDVTPSLYADEFATSSLKACSLFEVEGCQQIHSLPYPIGKVANPPPISTQPSNHPLVYYSSHPLGLMCSDFRESRPIQLTTRDDCISHLCQLDQDDYHYLIANQGSIELIDLRNPRDFELRWRYPGKIQEMRCMRCVNGTQNELEERNEIPYHILHSYLYISFISFHFNCMICNSQ